MWYLLQNLEELLRGYLGCVIVVSHDRCVISFHFQFNMKCRPPAKSVHVIHDFQSYHVCRAFMKNAVDNMFVLEGDSQGKVQRFAGDYEEYLAFITKRKAEKQARETAAANAARQEIAAAKTAASQGSGSNGADEVCSHHINTCYVKQGRSLKTKPKAELFLKRYEI